MKSFTRPFKTVILGLAVSLTLVTMGGSSYAAEKKPNKLQIIMQDLLKDTQALIEGIMVEDYDRIATSARRIASHPTPGMGVQFKLLRKMGGDLSTFKTLDDAVHDRAVAIGKAGQAKDMARATREFSALVEGCQSCHSRFKVKIHNILSK